uniref:Myb/SANT-like domain-containing protein n=1 Tax=Anopheles atroparvus TaxID=41427 RepID=A0A182JET5_ANOAO
MEEVAATIDVSDAAAMLGAATGPQEFKWTRESCLLLLHEYELLKDKFKDRKNKKKDLWAEISLKFKKIYACDLEWDVAYKKFRNLKQTFEQQHHPLDPATVGQVIGGEEFTEALANAFPLGDELEIPSHPPDTPPDEASKTEDDEVGPMPDVGEEYEEEEAEEEVHDEMEPPHRKRYRRRTSYQQERLEIEREKLHTLREIQRGIECKNDILQGILHVLQAKVWQTHPSND